MLFTGIDERDLEGLLFWGGVQSEHHKAALKRICPVVMSLIGHLVSLDYGDDSENIFFERYIRLPLDELIKLNFAAHMTEATKQSTDKGPLNNVCQLISLLLRDHCDVDTDQPDPLEIQSLLGDNGAITEHFMAWLQLTATTEIVSNISSERKKQVAIDRVRVVRPTTWAQVALKVVPVQPDEDGYGEKIDVDTDAHNRHVADPLGLVSTDLREIQTVHIGNSEKEQEENDDDMESRSRAQSRSRDPSTAPLIAAGAKRNSTMKGSDLFNLMRKISGAKDKVHSGGAGDTTTATTDSSITKSGKFSAVRSGDRGDVGVQVRAGAVSVLPIDRSFKPALFLALVHNKASMADLQTGLTNLQVLLDQQSNMRENLVRLHLGHFINCVDSIGWLKNYQFDNPTEMGYEESLGKRRKKAISGVATDVPEPGLTAAPIGRIDGEKMASQAVLKLEVAKKKALDTLAPILNSMKRSRQIKATDSILKRFASALDFPHLMQLALDKKDFEEVTRLNGRIKEMPNSVNLNIRNNIKSKANQILTQMRKILTNDALRQYPFSSLEEVLRLFKNLADIDSPSDYQIVLENCYERQHSLFLQRYAEITKSCDEDLKRASELDASHLLDVSHIPESISASSRPQLNNYKRSSRSTFGWDESRGEDQPAVGFGYIESDDEDSSADGDDSIIDEFWKTKDEAILFGSIRIKCLKKLEAEMRDSFPILQCMVTLLEASSVAGALPIESMLGSTSAVPTPDLAAGNYQSGILLAHSNSINLMSAPAALLKGMDVAYGRRHGGASKYANMLGTALHKYCLILKRLIEGFPDDVTSIAAAKEVSTASVHTAASAASPARRGLWSRIDDFEKVSTPAIEDIPLPPPPSATTTSMLFAQGSGDGFTAAAEKSILETQTNELLFHQNAINKCRELINEPFLSSSIRFLSDIVDNLELILAPTLSKIDDGTVGGGIWIRASSASAVGRASDSLRPVFFLPRSNPFFSSISSLHDVVHSGQEAIAAKALKVLEEAATRLMLSQEANAAIEMAQIEAGVESQKIRAGTDGNDAKESGKREGVISGETPIYDVNLLLYRACDNYKETYLGSRIRSAAASVIPLSLLNPELTSFNDNNSRTSANDDNEMNKYGVSLETKAYQLEYMIVHVLSSLHDSLRCPELVSNYVQSSIRVLFTQFLTDLSSAECPVLDAVGVVADDAANDQAGGLFGARRSAVSIDLEMIELDLKVDGGAGDKNVLIDGWYLDQIRACLAIRSLVVHRYS